MRQTLSPQNTSKIYPVFAGPQASMAEAFPIRTTDHDPKIKLGQVS